MIAQSKELDASVLRLLFTKIASVDLLAILPYLPFQTLYSSAELE